MRSLELAREGLGRQPCQVGDPCSQVALWGGKGLVQYRLASQFPTAPIPGHGYLYNLLCVRPVLGIYIQIISPPMS